MSSKLDKKLEKHSEKIIERLAELKELAFDKSDEVKKQIVEYIDSLIEQVDSFEKDLVQPDWEEQIRAQLVNPEKWKNVDIEDIPLQEFTRKQK